MIQSWTNVELDSKSPFVHLINQSHRMSNNPCKLSIRRLRCYRPVHSRAVDKLIPLVTARVQKPLRPSRKTRSPWRVTHNQPISNGFTALMVATVAMVATASDLWLRNNSYGVHNWLNFASDGLRRLRSLWGYQYVGGHFKNSNGARQLKTC